MAEKEKKVPKNRAKTTARPVTLKKTLLSGHAKDVGPEIKSICEKATQVCLIITAIDPDAVGAAMLFRYYLTVCTERNASSIKMYYGGAISHPQNKSIMNFFNLDQVFQPLPEDLEKEEGEVWVLLDSNDLNDTRVKTDLKPVDIVIDHHKAEMELDDSTKRTHFISNVGAATTLVTELLEHEISDFAELEADDEKTVSMTLGVLGIKNDTGNLLSQQSSERDDSAFFKLKPFTDREALYDIENYPLDDRSFSILRDVLHSRQVKNRRVIASAGFIDADEGDQLAESCSLLIRDMQVTLAVVWGVILDKSQIRLSVRSQDPTLNLFDQIKKAFGAGGAKQKRGAGEGGAILSLGDLGGVLISGDDEEEYRKDLLKLIGTVIEKRVSGILRDA